MVLSHSSIVGPSPKIRGHECNDLQTPKVSKKQLCDRARPCPSGQLLLHRRDGGLDTTRLVPGGILLLELVHEQLGRVFGGCALLLERSDSRLQDDEDEDEDNEDDEDDRSFDADAYGA